MEQKKSKWIKKAVKHPGTMTAAAKREGVSNSEYIAEHKHDSGVAGKRARLAETLGAMRHGGDPRKSKEAKAPTPSGMRRKMYGDKD